MTYPLRWLASLLFVAQMYLMMAVFGILFMPLAALSRDWAFRAIHIYCGWVRFTARWMIGLRSEIRGTPPADEVLVAAKHQSFFDIILLYSVMPRPKFIMKQSLMRAPFLGWYARRIGCVPIERGKRGAAITRMTADVRAGRAHPGQLVIYPQGTRVAPGVIRDYKIGTGVLYRQLNQDCVPAATNVGVFWPRTGIYRKPGLAVVEFLPRIPAGRPQAEFMAELRETVETASDALMKEAGFDADRAR